MTFSNTTSRHIGLQKKQLTELALFGAKQKLLKNIEGKLYTMGFFLDIR